MCLLSGRCAALAWPRSGKLGWLSSFQGEGGCERSDERGALEMGKEWQSHDPGQTPCPWPSSPRPVSTAPPEPSLILVIACSARLLQPRTSAQQHREHFQQQVHSTASVQILVTKTTVQVPAAAPPSLSSKLTISVTLSP